LGRRPADVHTGSGGLGHSDDEACHDRVRTRETAGQTTRSATASVLLPRRSRAHLPCRRSSSASVASGSVTRRLLTETPPSAIALRPAPRPATSPASAARSTTSGAG